MGEAMSIGDCNTITSPDMKKYIDECPRLPMFVPKARGGAGSGKVIVAITITVLHPPEFVEAAQYRVEYEETGKD